jgi:phospholipid/cholesterol/gamma-HCH transport system substrate-binding protein
MRRREGSEIVTGLLVLVAASLAVVGYYWLTGESFTRRGYPLVVRLRDAGGLQRGDRLRLAGVDVGRVRGVHLSSSAVLADVQVDPDLRLARDSRADLRPAGAFGGRYLELTPGRSAEALEPGDTLAAASVPSLTETFTVLGDRATEVLARASDVLAPSRVATLDQGLRSLTRTLDNAAAVSASVRSTALEIHRGLGDGRLEETTAGLATSSHNLADASAELRSAAGTLSSILTKVDRGEGSLGRAVNDPTLYNALQGATIRFDSVTRDAKVVVRDAGELVRDVRAHPRRYVRVTLF